MIQENIEQAAHNQQFHECIEKNFKDRFCDWQITVLFYIAIHYLKALAVHRGKDIGNTHFEIERSVNPSRLESQMKITNNAWYEYKSLFDYSRIARYEGIGDAETFQRLKQIDHQYCKEHLRKFKLYVQGQGVII